MPTARSRLWDTRADGAQCCLFTNDRDPCHSVWDHVILFVLINIVCLYSCFPTRVIHSVRGKKLIFNLRMISLISRTKVLVKFSVSKNTAYMCSVWGCAESCVDETEMNEMGLGSATLLRVPFLLRLCRTWLWVTRAIVTTQRATEVPGKRGGTVISGAYVLLSRVSLPLTESPDVANWHWLQRRPQRANSVVMLTVMRSFHCFYGDWNLVMKMLILHQFDTAAVVTGTGSLGWMEKI